MDAAVEFVRYVACAHTYAAHHAHHMHAHRCTCMQRCIRCAMPYTSHVMFSSSLHYGTSHQFHASLQSILDLALAYTPTSIHTQHVMNGQIRVWQQRVRPVRVLQRTNQEHVMQHTRMHRVMNTPTRRPQIQQHALTTPPRTRTAPIPTPMSAPPSYGASHASHAHAWDHDLDDDVLLPLSRIELDATIHGVPVEATSTSTSTSTWTSTSTSTSTAATSAIADASTELPPVMQGDMYQLYTMYGVEQLHTETVVLLKQVTAYHVACKLVHVHDVMCMCMCMCMCLCMCMCSSCAVV